MPASRRTPRSKASVVGLEAVYELVSNPVLPGRITTDCAIVVGSERWKAFAYDNLIGRGKVNLDIAWLRDQSPEDADNLPAPEIIGREIEEDLTAAQAEFEAVVAALEASASDRN